MRPLGVFVSSSRLCIARNSDLMMCLFLQWHQHQSRARSEKTAQFYSYTFDNNGSNITDLGESLKTTCQQNQIFYNNSRRGISPTFPRPTSPSVFTLWLTHTCRRLPLQLYTFPTFFLPFLVFTTYYILSNTISISSSTDLIVILLLNTINTIKVTKYFHFRILFLGKSLFDSQINDATVLNLNYSVF